MNYANLPKQPYPTEAQAIRVSPIEETINRLDKSIAVLTENVYSISSQLISVSTPELSGGEPSVSVAHQIRPVTCRMEDQISELACRVDNANKFLVDLKSRIQL